MALAGLAFFPPAKRKQKKLCNTTHVALRFSFLLFAYLMSVILNSFCKVRWVVWVKVGCVEARSVRDAALITYIFLKEDMSMRILQRSM